MLGCSNHQTKINIWILVLNVSVRVSVSWIFHMYSR